MRTKEQQGNPVTFRPKDAHARAALEAVAQHKGTNVSRLVAEIVDGFVREYIAEVTPEQLQADLQEAADLRERRLQRQMQQFMEETGVVPGAGTEDSSSSQSTQDDDVVAGSGR